MQKIFISLRGGESAQNHRSEEIRSAAKKVAHERVGSILLVSLADEVGRLALDAILPMKMDDVKSLVLTEARLMALDTPEKMMILAKEHEAENVWILSRPGTTQKTCSAIFINMDMNLLPLIGSQVIVYDNDEKTIRKANMPVEVNPDDHSFHFMDME